jgi:hypothetical protein
MGQRRSHCSNAFRPESFLVSLSARGLVMMGSREGPSTMKHRMGSAAMNS